MLSTVQPVEVLDMPIASRAEKQQVIQAMKESNKKYAKPFDSGKLSNFSVMGGNWEQYAAIIMDMVTADTLLDVDEKLERLNGNIERLIAVLER